MQTRNALDIALQVYRQPALVRQVRSSSLPPRVLSVIKIAAGSDEDLQLPAAHVPEKTQEIRDAAIFFLQNCLFQSGGDSYRVLGVEPGTPVDEIRLHKRWLLKWLHPDLNRNTWEAAYLQRVLAAWQDIGGDLKPAAPPAGSPGSTSDQGRRPPRHYRRRLPRHLKASSEPGRLVRKTAAIVMLSLIGFLAFRLFNGNQVTGMLQFLAPLGQRQW
jgi:hypothetical protein